ncbi:MAG: choice-of-anchor E domain-containing protein [Planctomycetota bacterium]|nr:choice-of-anchor E domain-containing protein [Planctomycetota bacterium]
MEIIGNAPRKAALLATLQQLAQGVRKGLWGLIPLGLLAGHALGGETTHVVSLPLHHALATSPSGPDHEQAWQDVLYAPGHDARLGVLTGVSLELTHWTSTRYMYENLSANGGHAVTWGRVNSALHVADPADDSRSIISHSTSYGDYQIQSGPGDGVMDWDGRGGHTSPLFTRLSHADGRQALQTRIALAPWTAPQVALRVHGRSQFLMTSQDNWYAFGMQYWSGGRLRVTYHWD